jgi:hypothetical protein
VSPFDEPLSAVQVRLRHLAGDDLRQAGREYPGVALDARAEAVERLVDVPHGRARADVPARLQKACRAIERTVACAYREREQRSATATALALADRGEDHQNHPRNRAGRRLEQLTEVAQELGAVLGRVDA